MAAERFIVVFALAAAASLISMASAIPGTATFYSTYVPSACYGNVDQGTMIAAANPLLFNNGDACGHRYTIQCNGPINPGAPSPCRNGPITVAIVDLCVKLELSRNAFFTIADPSATRIRIA